MVGGGHQWHPAGLFMEGPLDPTWYQATENGGTTLEWRIPVTYVPGNYSYWGAVVQMTGGDTTTLDITGRGETPEPTTLALLGIGLGGLIARRRRRS
jgi:hypothetical protein